MKALSDYMLITDMDGTLLGTDGEVPARNAEAIRRFTAAGGKFGIATGRSRGLMVQAAKGLPVNGPCVLYNGGALYDYGRDEMLTETFLPKDAAAYVEALDAQIPEMGILVISGDTYYQIRTERAFSDFLEQRDRFLVNTDMRDAPGGWYKVLFLVQEQFTEQFFAFTGERAFPGVRFVSTNPTLIEMLPAGSNKAAALQYLLDREIVDRQHLVTVGDYYNDAEMIRMAGIGATLSTSPRDLREMADLVVGDCDGGAVADVIEHLESLCGG